MGTYVATISKGEALDSYQAKSQTQLSIQVPQTPFTSRSHFDNDSSYFQWSLEAQKLGLWTACEVGLIAYMYIYLADTTP